MVALLPEGHALTQQASVKLNELCHDPFVLTEAGSSELVERLFHSARLKPNVRYRCSQLLSTLDTVSRGAGMPWTKEPSSLLGRSQTSTAIATPPCATRSMPGR